MVWKEIDIRTGKEKLRTTVDYGSWEEMSANIDEDGNNKYEWKQGDYDIISMRIMIPKGTKSKQCRVDFSRNWIKIWAPAMIRHNNEIMPDDVPPVKPLYDFQLYGAVDTELCDWQIERLYGGVEVYLVIELKKSPVYNWPTLHRENGLQKEEHRKIVAERERRETAEKEGLNKTASKAGMPVNYQKPAGPPRPPSFGPKNAKPKPPPLDPNAPPTRPPGSYERGRIIVSEAPDSDED